MTKVILKTVIFFVFFITSLIAQDAPKKVIYISVGYWGDLFDIKNPLTNRDNCLEPLCDFRNAAAKAGYEIRQTGLSQPLGDFEYLIVFEVFPQQIKQIETYPKEKLILFLWEPPSVLPQNYNPHYTAIFPESIHGTTS